MPSVENEVENDERCSNLFLCGGASNLLDSLIHDLYKQPIEDMNET